MQISCKDSKGELVGKPDCDLSRKTILVLPCMLGNNDSPDIVLKYINNLESLLANTKNVNICSASWSAHSDAKQEVINYNRNPTTYYNDDTKMLVDRVFMPILRNKDRIPELRNLTIFAASYGSAQIGMLENCLHKAMDCLGYSEDEQKKIIGKICAISIVPATNIYNKSASFQQVLIAPTNDRVNSSVNLRARHITSRHDVEPSYQRINGTGLLISAPIPTIKFDHGIIYDDEGHRPALVMKKGHKLPPDILSTVLPVVLDNAVERETDLHDLTKLLKPRKPKATVAGQEGYGFTAQVSASVLEDFLAKGGRATH